MFAANILAGMAAAVAELDRGFGAAAVNRFDQAGEPGQEAVVINAELAMPVPPRLFRRGHFHRDQADSAFDPRPVIGHRVVGDEALGIRRARRHRRQHDAIADLYFADPRRREENIHRTMWPQSCGDAQAQAGPDHACA